MALDYETLRRLASQPSLSEDILATPEASTGPYDMATQFVPKGDSRSEHVLKGGETKYQDLVDAMFKTPTQLGLPAEFQENRFPETPSEMRKATGGVDTTFSAIAPFAQMMAHASAVGVGQVGDTLSELAQGKKVSHPYMAGINAAGLVPLVGTEARAGRMALTEAEQAIAAGGEAAKSVLPYYSKLYKTFADMPEKAKFSVEQLIGKPEIDKATGAALTDEAGDPKHIGGTLRNAGVKDLELEWTGFQNWAKQQPGPISRKDAMDYLEKNLIDIRELIGETALNKYFDHDLHTGIRDMKPVSPGEYDAAYASPEATKEFNANWLKRLSKSVDLGETPISKEFEQWAVQHDRPITKEQAYAWHKDIADRNAKGEVTDLTRKLVEREPQIMQAPDDYARQDAINAAWGNHPDLSAALNQATEHRSGVRYYDPQYRGDQLPQVGSTRWGRHDHTLGPANADPSSYKEMRVMLRTPPDRPLKGNFPSYWAQNVHWKTPDDKNILFHFRYDSRTDPKTGRKMLFIHELQGDWGQSVQAVRKEQIAKLMKADPALTEEAASAKIPETTGFYNEKAVKAAMDREKLAREKIQAFEREHNLDDGAYTGRQKLRDLQYKLEDLRWELSNVDRPNAGGQQIDPRALQAHLAPVAEKVAAIDAEKKQLQAVLNEHTMLQHEVSNAVNARQDAAGSNTFPRGPYVDDVNKWTDLAIKRILHYASDHGYDDIGWTPGDIQAFRNNKRQLVSRITWDAQTGALESFSPGPGSEHVTLSPNAYPSNIRKYVTDEQAKELESQIYRGQRVAEITLPEPKLMGQMGKDYYDKRIGQRIVANGKSLKLAVNPYGHNKVKVFTKDQLKSLLGEVGYYGAVDHEALAKAKKNPTLENIKAAYGGKIPNVLRRSGVHEDMVGWEGVGKRKSANNDQSLYQNIHSLSLTPAQREAIRLGGFPLSAIPGVPLASLLAAESLRKRKHD